MSAAHISGIPIACPKKFFLQYRKVRVTGLKSSFKAAEKYTVLQSKSANF